MEFQRAYKFKSGRGKEENAGRGNHQEFPVITSPSFQTSFLYSLSIQCNPSIKSIATLPFLYIGNTGCDPHRACMENVGNQFAGHCENYSFPLCFPRRRDGCKEIPRTRKACCYCSVSGDNHTRAIKTRHPFGSPK